MTLEERLEAARIEWEKWEKRAAANKVRTTADWHLYQRAFWTYESVLKEENAALKAETAVLSRRLEELTR